MYISTAEKEKSQISRGEAVVLSHGMGGRAKGAHSKPWGKRSQNSICIFCSRVLQTAFLASSFCHAAAMGFTCL